MFKWNIKDHNINNKNTKGQQRNTLNFGQFLTINNLDTRVKIFQTYIFFSYLMLKFIRKFETHCLVYCLKLSTDKVWWSLYFVDLKGCRQPEDLKTNRKAKKHPK